MSNLKIIRKEVFEVNGKEYPTLEAAQQALERDSLIETLDNLAYCGYGEYDLGAIVDYVLQNFIRKEELNK
jgi:hypothetical protein